MSWLSTLGKYLAEATVGVVAVESAVGSSVPGTTKKQIVLNALDAGAQAVGGLGDGQVSIIANLIDGIVKAFNASGIFQHKAAGAVAVPATDPPPPDGPPGPPHSA